MPDNAGLENHKPTSLEGIALTASLNKDHRFRNLYRELTPELLLSAWMTINKDAASGVDKITAEDYQEHLLKNIQHLAQRLKEKRYKGETGQTNIYSKRQWERTPVRNPRSGRQNRATCGDDGAQRHL